MTAASTTAAPPARPGGGALRRSAAWSRRAPLLPAMIFMIIVTQLPFVATLVISTLDWNSFRPGERSFVFLDNYKTVFTDTALRQAVVNTAIFTAAVVLVSVALGLGIALLLDRSFRGRGVVRTMMIAPFLVMPIAAALLWKHALLNPDYGLFNGVLTWIGDIFGDGSPPQPAWISEMPKIAIIASLVWQWTPFMMLILLAGLQSRDGEVMEAATIDGAGGWQTFRYITMPHVRRYLELSIVLGTIFIVQNFDSILGMTGGLNSTNIPYAVYEVFYSAKDYGVASALGVVVVIGSIIVATFGLRVVSSLLSEEEAR